MSAVEPAVAHMECPTCGEVVDVAIPVKVTIDANMGMFAEVDQAGWSAQEVWDHALAAHGPVPKP